MIANTTSWCRSRPLPTHTWNGVEEVSRSTMPLPPPPPPPRYVIIDATHASATSAERMNASSNKKECDDSSDEASLSSMESSTCWSDVEAEDQDVAFDDLDRRPPSSDFVKIVADNSPEITSLCRKHITLTKPSALGTGKSRRVVTDSTASLTSRSAADCCYSPLLPPPMMTSPTSATTATTASTYSHPDPLLTAQLQRLWLGSGSYSCSPEGSTKDEDEYADVSAHLGDRIVLYHAPQIPYEEESTPKEEEDSSPKIRLALPLTKTTPKTTPKRKRQGRHRRQSHVMLPTTEQIHFSNKPLSLKRRRRHCRNTVQLVFRS